MCKIRNNTNVVTAEKLLKRIQEIHELSHNIDLNESYQLRKELSIIIYLRSIMIDFKVNTLVNWLMLDGFATEPVTDDDVSIVNGCKRTGNGRKIQAAGATWTGWTCT